MYYVLTFVNRVGVDRIKWGFFLSLLANHLFSHFCLSVLAFIEGHSHVLLIRHGHKNIKCSEEKKNLDAVICTLHYFRLESVQGEKTKKN